MYTATYELSEHSEFKFLTEDKMAKAFAKGLSSSISKASTAR
jgi:hypothetical protein